MSAKDAGQKFLEQILALVPEDKRAAAQEALAGNETLVTELGNATLRQSDYSRQMNALREAEEKTKAWHAELDTWYAANAARLAAGDPNPNPNPNPAGNPNPAPNPSSNPIQSPNAVTRELLAEEFATRERAAMNAIVFTTQLASKHYATFKEPLDITSLMADPDIPKLGLHGVYDKHYKPKYDEIAQKAETDRIEAEVQKRLAATRTSHMPYPVHGREPSPLDALEKAIASPPDPTKPVQAPVGSQHVVDQAVAEYEAALARQYGQPTI